VVELTDTTFTINTYRTDNTEFKIVNDGSSAGENTENNTEGVDKSNPSTGDASAVTTSALLRAAAVLVKKSGMQKIGIILLH